MFQYNLFWQLSTFSRRKIELLSSTSSSRALSCRSFFLQKESGYSSGYSFGWKVQLVYSVPLASLRFSSSHFSATFLSRPLTTGQDLPPTNGAERIPHRGDADKLVAFFLRRVAPYSYSVRRLPSILFTSRSCSCLHVLRYAVNDHPGDIYPCGCKEQDDDDGKSLDKRQGDHCHNKQVHLEWSQTKDMNMNCRNKAEDAVRGGFARGCRWRSIPRSVSKKFSAFLHQLHGVFYSVSFFLWKFHSKCPLAHTSFDVDIASAPSTPSELVVVFCDKSQPDPYQKG